MCKRTRLFGVLLACGLLLGFAIPAFAGDGVIEINQAKVLANGGFPYQITQPGSYRLTSNLNVTASGVDAIAAMSNGVTIDLNGFSITGPGGTSGSACGSGIGVAGSSNATVVNGVIQGFYIGVSFYSGGHVEKVHAVFNCNVGISGSYGMTGTVVNNVVSNNGVGIYMGEGLVTGNYVEGNTGLGLYASNPGTGYSNNVFYANNNNGFQVAGGLQIGTNLCNGVVCP